MCDGKISFVGRGFLKIIADVNSEELSKLLNERMCRTLSKRVGQMSGRWVPIAAEEPLCVLHTYFDMERAALGGR